MKSFPESVYEFGDFLVAHPWIVRVKLDRDTMVRYLAELSCDQFMPFGREPVVDYYFTWKRRVACILADKWPHRYDIWPPRAYR